MGLKRNRKKRHTHQVQETKPSELGPRILIVHRGTVGPVIPYLIKDMLNMLSPHSVRTIKVLRNHRIKDLVSASSPLHITHSVIFTRTEKNLYMKLCTMPHGPTITFSIDGYCLQRDVLSSQKRPPGVPYAQQAHAPCLIMNNLQPHSGPRHLQLVASSMLQIFPKIVPNESSCKTIHRCCLLNYEEVSEVFDLRQYVIKLTNTAAARLVSKLVNSKNIPDLHKYGCIEDAIDGGAASESEAEEDYKIDLSGQLEDCKRPHSNKSAIKMKDAGPRLTFKLHKIESGLLSGEVLYNRVVKRSAKERKELKLAREQKKKEKAERRQKQEDDVARKKKEADEHKVRCLEGMSENLRERAVENMKKKLEKLGKLDEIGDDAPYLSQENPSDSEEDSKYYEEEVGEAPESGLSCRMKRRREKDFEALAAKKRKLEEIEKKKIEARKAKKKAEYKLLNERKKRPRSYGKRLAKKMKQKIKAQKAAKSKEHDNEEDRADNKKKSSQNNRSFIKKK